MREGKNVTTSPESLLRDSLLSFLLDASPQPLGMRARFPLDLLLHRQTVADFLYSLDPLGNLHSSLGLCGAGSNAA
jgi:hypothetical protein